MTKKDHEGFEKSTKCWICENDYVCDVKVIDHFRITGKYKGCEHKDCNIMVKGKFGFKINVIPNELQNIYEL